jgi:hypothetical protein
MSVVAHALDFALYRPMLQGLFCVVCDYVSYLFHDHSIYNIFMCYFYKHFPQGYELSALLCHVPLKTTET